MDLTSGTPFWLLSNGLPAVYPRLRRDLRCDLAVIGGGITGALVAHRFAREGIHTAVLEAREIGHGSTSATTALIQYEIDTHLCDLIAKVGRSHAERSYQLCLEAVHGIEALASADGDRCGWRTTGSLYLGSRRSDRPVLERERVARRAAGIEVQLLTDRDIGQRFSFTRPVALLSPAAGEVDAYRLTHQLLGGAVAAGLEVYDRTKVVEYLSRGRVVELRTADGCCVRARRVVFATGYETPSFLQRGIVRLRSTFALATAPVERFDGWGEDRCLIWETARPCFYARTTADGRAIAGGADQPYATAHSRARLLTRQTTRVARHFARLFPAIPCDVDWRWGGTFGETRDGLPYIGSVARFPNGYFALGYGGNGITFSWIAANLLLDRFLDRRNPDARIFRFDR